MKNTFHHLDVQNKTMKCILLQSDALVAPYAFKTNTAAVNTG